MKNNRLPLYILIVLFAAAVIWRIANPPAPPLPGPIGTFPNWKSTATMGDMSCQAANPTGSMWAGAWNAKKGDKEQAAVRVIDFNGYSATKSAMPENDRVEYLSWADSDAVRAFCVGPAGNSTIVYVDGATGETKQKIAIDRSAEHVLSWPAAGDKLAVVFEQGDDSMQLGVLSESAKGIVGKEVTFAMPKGAALEAGGGVAADGSSFVFSISDPAAKDSRAFYLADTGTGIAKKAFDLGDVPGRIEGMWPSAGGILIVCNVKGKLLDVVYDPATNKLTEEPKGIGDLSKFPGAPQAIGLTNYDSGFDFNLATGKAKIVVDMTKKSSESDKQWRDLLRDSRLYKLKNGDFVTVSETGGAVDIRQIKPDGSVDRALLPRM